MSEEVSSGGVDLSGLAEGAHDRVVCRLREGLATLPLGLDLTEPDDLDEEGEFLKNKINVMTFTTFWSPERNGKLGGRLSVQF